MRLTAFQPALTLATRSLLALTTALPRPATSISPTATAPAVCASMSLPPRALLVGTLIQPNNVYNPGAPVARDLTVQYYDQPELRAIDVRRVLVVDATRRAALLTTPMRVMAAWHARETASSAAPYLAISGWQPPIPADVAERYFATLAAARAGNVVAVAGATTVHAVPVGERVQPGPTTEVLSGITQANACWLRLFAENFSGVESSTAYVADELDFAMPPALSESGKTVLLLREEESDVAMGSPMITMPDGNGVISDGIQFRGGYGAKWDDEATHVELRNPFYSPRHRMPASNRVWSFGG